MKVFISQPMRGLAERKIKLNRAKAIELLSKADIIYLCKGWNKARGCKIEYMCASDYDIKIIFEEGD